MFKGYVTGHPTGDRTFVLQVGRCLVSVDFATDVHRIYTPSGDLLTIGANDGIDWRTILLKEREYRGEQASRQDGTTDLLRAVDAVLYGQEFLGAPDDAVNYGWLDDGRAG